MRQNLTRSGLTMGLALAALILSTGAVSADGTESWTINEREERCFQDELYDFGINDVGVVCYDLFHDLRHYTETPTGYMSFDHVWIDVTVTYRDALLFAQQYQSIRHVQWKGLLVQAKYLHSAMDSPHP
jgi:hypothetical protein